MAICPKKIILLTRLFPPQRSVGGRRLEQMARYFAARGWRVSVVAPRDASSDAAAHAAVQASMAGVRITYTAAPRNRLPLPAPIWESHAGDGGHGPRQGVVKSILRFVRDLLVFPDNANLWIPLGYAAARREIRGEDPVYIVTSSPPVSTHVAGLLLKLRYGSRVKWIPDFRDPSFHPRLAHSRRLVDRLLVRLARRVTDSADLILVTTEAITGTFAQYSAAVPGSLSIRCVPNGVPAGLFDDVRAELLAPTKTVFVHLGDLHYAHRTPEPLIRALGELVADGRLRPGQFELHFFGQAGSWHGLGIRDMARTQGCGESVFEHEAVEHRRALSIMHGADALVLLAEGQPLSIPAKTYEYLASGAAVLAFCEADGATGKLLAADCRVRTVSARQPDALKAAVMDLVTEREAKGRLRREPPQDGVPLEIEWHLEKMIGVLEGL